MTLIRKDQAGAAPGYTWENDGDVVDVAEPELVADLLRIDGFSEVITSDTSDGDEYESKQLQEWETNGGPASEDKPKKSKAKK
ncbi:MAG: hypothetical protein ACYDCC_04820 [Actinomycetota bacterium]